MLVGLAGMLAAACGSQTQAASEPTGKFPVTASASFPTPQRISAHIRLVVRVTNAGNRTVPDVAVTITDGIPSHPDWGTQVQAFNYLLNQSDVASHSRPVWVVDQGPGPCQYSCHSGGPGGAVTAFSNTWALGPLKPHRTAVFTWHLTPVQPGAWVVNWRVAAGLFGNAKAVTPGGGIPRGSFTIHVSQVPAQSYVSNNGTIVTTASGQP
jgi:hypothetical protein